MKNLRKVSPAELSRSEEEEWLRRGLTGRQEDVCHRALHITARREVLGVPVKQGRCNGLVFSVLIPKNALLG